MRDIFPSSKKIERRLYAKNYTILVLLCYEVTQYARQTFLVRCHFSAGSKGSVGGVARSPRLVPCAASQSKSGCVAPDVPVGLPDRRLPGTPGFLNPDWSPAP